MKEILEKLDTNIIKWYDFDSTENVLQIGENNNITEYLKTIFSEVKVVSKKDKIYLNDEKFDYILIYEIEKVENYKDIILSKLKENGKVLLIGNNQLGINNFSKYHFSEDCYAQEIEKDENLLDSIETIKSKLKDFGFNVNIYSVYPNYKQAELIFNENFNISKNQIEKYNPDISEEDIKVFDEIKILKKIITNNKEMLTNLCNSFFIEISKNSNLNSVQYASFNNVRKDKYKLITLIKDDVVEKKIAEKEAEEHLNQIKDNITNLQDLGFNILDYYDNNSESQKIYSKLIKNEKTLDEIFAENYQNKSFIIESLKKVKEKLIKNSITYEDCKDKITYCKDESLLKNLHFMEKCYWDLIPKNCFYINNEFYFFDQEWEEDYLPVEFVIYRSIINSYDLIRHIDVNDILNELNLKEYRELFEYIDKLLRDRIIDKEVYNEMYAKNIKGIDNYINDNKIYAEEIERNKKHIKDLENYVKALENDNKSKQEYIEKLEKKDLISILKRIKRGKNDAK